MEATQVDFSNSKNYYIEIYLSKVVYFYDQIANILLRLGSKSNTINIYLDVSNYTIYSQFFDN